MDRFDWLALAFSVFMMLSWCVALGVAVDGFLGSGQYPEWLKMASVTYVAASAFGFVQAMRLFGDIVTYELWGHV